MGKEAAIVIEAMRVEDVDQVLAIERTSFTMPWSKNLFLTEFKNPLFSFMLVALSDPLQRTVAGYSVCWVLADELHILDLAVKPDCRRQGIARRLALESLAQAHERGARKAYLEVRESNIPAQQLYESLGFTRAAKRRDYYDAPPEDAIVMALDQESWESIMKTTSCRAENRGK